MHIQISLTSYNSVRDGKFRTALLHSMEDKLFTIEDTQDFLYTMLINVSPVNQSLVNDTCSLDNACYEILKHFNILRIPEARLRDLSHPAVPIQIGQQSFTERFWKHILQLRILPAGLYKKYQQLIVEDIADLKALIDWYQTDDFILKLDKGEVSKGYNHKERIKKEFYGRCTSEYNKVISYLKIDFQSNVLKAAADNLFGYLLEDNEFYKQHILLPYDFAKPYSHQFYDYREIDQVAHRLLNGHFDEDMMTALYSKDKISFYDILFEKNSHTDIFAECYEYLHQLPVKNDRISIFQELNFLFINEKWIAFYALALSQVEGLFSEMNASSMSKGKLGAIPEKVRALRPFHDMSKYYFDYFEYHLPNLRNKFMHVGYDTDYQIKSYDLLFDLRFLLKTFFELNAPIVRLEVLWVRKQQSDFQTLSDFARYFKLLNALPADKRQSLLQRQLEFSKDFLQEVYSASNIAQDITDNLPAHVDKFLNEMEHHLIKNPTDDLLTMSLSFLNDPKNVERLDIFFSFKQEEYNRILEYRSFLCNYRDHISTTDNLKSLRGSFIHKINLIADIGAKVTTTLS